MPLKRDYQVSEQWFISHTPFDLGESELNEDINQMVSYDIQPLPINVDYRLGTVQGGELFRIVMRNLTQNSILRIGATYNKTFLKLLSDDDVMIEQDNITLARGETRSARVFVNTDVLNSETGDTPVETDVTLIISHIANGDLVKRDNNMVPLEQSTIDSIVAR
jgi:hypothetical protein